MNKNSFTAVALENLKKLAAESSGAQQFRSRVKGAYPDYVGENYLDMTANMFFKR